MSSPSVLFDLGNVLVKLDLERGLAHFRRLAGDRLPALSQVDSLFFHERSLACNRGALAPAEYLVALRELLQAPELSIARLTDAWCDIFDRWPEMEALASDVLGAGHGAYLLSNTDPLHFAFLREQIPVLRRLTGLYLSYEVGLLKPDPAFFQVALRRFGLEPQACVFLDDRPEHVESARSVGIPALMHRGDPAEARAFLREHGVRV